MNSILEKRQKYHIEEQEGISQSFALGEVKDEEHAAEGGNEMEATDEEKQILREAAECLKTIGVSKAFEKLQTLLGKSSFYSQLILEKLKKEDGKAKRKSALLRKVIVLLPFSSLNLYLVIGLVLLLFNLGHDKLTFLSRLEPDDVSPDDLSAEVLAAC
ncbi:unnamed protein product [Soboliphyme baturini]|uniref:Transmembrane protein n=1 Tax=Soboliphyme baturini TaxID=241478 RepID=A0A183IA71_9BILA|nr:unnamed protein product [Soboliphyme baturini]